MSEVRGCQYVCTSQPVKVECSAGHKRTGGYNRCDRERVVETSRIGHYTPQGTGTTTQGLSSGRRKPALAFTQLLYIIQYHRTTGWLPR